MAPRWLWLGRLGLLMSTWLLQKQARSSEQDLCEDCLKGRRGVQIFCVELLVNLGDLRARSPTMRALIVSRCVKFKLWKIATRVLRKG